MARRRAPLARVVGLFAGMALLASCGTVTGDGPGGDVASQPAGAQVRDCADVPWIFAEESAYRDEPVYGNADSLSEEVHGWASGQPGFVQLGLDREHNGWITVWVKDADVEAMRSEVAERWPDEGIVVVEVPWTVAELEAVRDEAQRALDEASVRTGGSGLMPHRGVVEISLGVITREALEVLAPFAHRPLCITGTPADEAPEEKEQPTAGPGWRLLGEGLTGEAYRTGVATTDEQLDQVWRAAGLPAAPPEVDWEGEVAVWFGAVYGSGCPVRLDGVEVVGDLVHADLVAPGEDFGCNADANPHAFVVAVEREVLPEGPFRVQLRAADPYPGTPEERTVVDVDLSTPGSTAEEEQIHLDEGLAMPQEDPLVADGDDLPEDSSVRYVWHDDPDCDVPTLGPLDGSVWRLADREAPWDVAPGDEVTLHPLGGSPDELISSAPQSDWLFARLPDGRTCP